jgi:hypothetical protein
VPQDEDVPQDETAQPEEPAAAVGVHAPEPDIAEAPVAQEADADARDAEPERAAEPVAAGNGEGAAPYATYREDATATTPYNYWDSGADSGFHEPDRVPTLPGEVIDEDAPPFATAPFAAVPRLNRVRSTPTPPEGDDEEE